MKLRLLTLTVFLSSFANSQNFLLKDVTNIEKDTIYSTEDLSLITGLVIDHFENGMIKIYGEYKNGIKNGEFKKWHSNGQLILKGNYVDGIENGVFEEFDIYGKKILKIKYKEGIILWEKDYTGKYR
jgi:antitoxin component YwqK of YwqJK toxin-antitoxin module